MGFAEFSKALITSCRLGDNGGLPNSVISAPAMKVRPSQARMPTLMSGSSARFWTPSMIALRTPMLMALTGGLLIQMMPISPRFSNRPCMGLSPKGPIIDHTAIDPLFSRLARYTLDERTGGQMKKLAKIGIGIVVFFVLAYTAVMYFTAGMANTADAFFQSIKKQDIVAARGYLSADFKASTDEAALRTFLSNTALLHFKKASWSNREISGGRAADGGCGAAHPQRRGSSCVGQTIDARLRAVDKQQEHGAFLRNLVANV